MLRKILSSPVKVMVGISSVLLMVIVLLVTSDVTGRYLFKHPVEGANELSGLLLLCAAVCAFSYTKKEGKHVRVELFINLFHNKSLLVLDIFNYLIALVMTALITWQMFVAARKYFLGLQGGTLFSEQLGIPWLPFLIILGLGFGVFALVILTDIVIALVKGGHK